MPTFGKLIGRKGREKEEDAGTGQVEQYPDTLQDLEAYSISTEGKLGLDQLYEPQDKAAATVE
jgi:hypothetical protein